MNEKCLGALCPTPRCEAVRAYTLRLLCLLACLWCGTPPAHAGKLRPDGPWPHYVFPHTGATVTIKYRLEGNEFNKVSAFAINVDGVNHGATLVDMGYGEVEGHVTVPVTTNPQEFQTYATALAQRNSVDPDEQLDSRDPDNDTDGTNGIGMRSDFITCDINLKSLTWENRPNNVNVYDHVNEAVYPNAAEPYHVAFEEFLGMPSVEYLRPAVYIKGAAPLLELEVEPLTGSVPVRVNTWDFNLSPTTPGYPFSRYTLLNGNTANILCPPLKNEVNVINASFESNFQCQFQDGFWSGIYGRQADEVDGMRLFAVYAQPRVFSSSDTAPDNTPWISVLEQACSWAAGQSTYDDVARYATTGLYYSQMFDYDTIEARSRYTNEFIRMKFRLTKFLNDPTPKKANCLDVSDYLCICASTLGLNFRVAAYRSEPAYTCKSNPLCVTGDDSTVDSNYQVLRWDYHQVCLSNGGQGNVYDAVAAQKLDLNGDQYRLPPFNWPLNGYWQTLSTTPSTGLVNYLQDENGLYVQESSSPVPFGDSAYIIPYVPYEPQVF